MHGSGAVGERRSVGDQLTTEDAVVKSVEQGRYGRQMGLEREWERWKEKGEDILSVHMAA